MVRLLLLGKKRMEEAGEPTPAKIIVADDPQLRIGEDSSTMADTVANFLIDASPKGGVRRIYG